MITLQKTKQNKTKQQQQQKKQCYIKSSIPKNNKLNHSNDMHRKVDNPNFHCKGQFFQNL